MNLMFQETFIKTMKLKNRFFKAALYEALATEDGHLTQELYDLYAEYAKGGVGTILTGYTYVLEEEHPAPTMMGIYNDSFIEEYKRFTDYIHTYDTNIILQLVYGGSFSSLHPHSKHILGPSAVLNERTGITPYEMSAEDFIRVKDGFRQAARRAKAAGFDGIQIHAAHGYLFSLFLNPTYNVREDEYGGSIENRARFLIEVYKELRDEVGVDYPIFIKINSQDYMKHGLTPIESMYVCETLSSLGIDAIELSGGMPSTEVLSHNLGPIRKGIKPHEESYFKEYAIELSKRIHTPLILTGGNRNIDTMNNLVSLGIPYFGLGRALTFEPELINVWHSGNTRHAKCISCNQCFYTVGKRCVFRIKEY